MTIKHHLNEQLLMGYAAGALPEAFDLIVATHVSMCDQCRAELAACEAIGGAVLEEIEGLAVDEAALAQIIAQLSDDQVEIPTPTSGKSLPAPIQQYVGSDIDQIPWKSLGGGVKQAILKTSKGASARLLHIEAGRAVPDHGHRGTELTLVLQGAFSDHVDHFGRGDLEIADEDLNHTPVAAAGEVCICLAATDAPLRFNALIPRLLQPVFRI